MENAFRSIKTVDLKVRPIHHRNADRVRSHVFLCMLAYYVEWHMRSVLKPVLFDDEETATIRPDPVAPKEPSRSAKAKARTKRTPDAQPVHSFQSLLADLATITRNTIVPAIPAAPGWDQDTEPTPLQKKMSIAVPDENRATAILFWAPARESRTPRSPTRSGCSGNSASRRARSPSVKGW